MAFGMGRAGVGSTSSRERASLGRDGNPGQGGCRVALVETPSLRNMESEVATSCSQAGLPVEGGGYQPTHKTYNPKFALPAKCARIEMEQRLRE